MNENVYIVYGKRRPPCKECNIRENVFSKNIYWIKAVLLRFQVKIKFPLCKYYGIYGACFEYVSVQYIVWLSCL